MLGITLRSILCAAMVSAIGCGGGERVEYYNSPTLVFNAFKTNLRTQKFKKAAECVDPDSQTAITAFVVNYGVTAKDQPELRKILTKHGIAKDARPGDKFEIKDKPTFISDVFDYLTKRPDSAELKKKLAIYDKVELTDLVITGDVANGKIGESDIRFKKIEGAWYLELKSSMGQWTAAGN